MPWTWASFHCYGINFCENFLRDVKRGVSCRNTTIDCALQQHFPDFLTRDLVIERGANMHPKFIATVQRNHHRKGQKAARMARQTGRDHISPHA